MRLNGLIFNANFYSFSLTESQPSDIPIRDGPLENLLGGGGKGNFRAAEIFFSLSNSLCEFFLGHSMNIFLGLIGEQEFFFI